MEVGVGIGSWPGWFWLKLGLEISRQGISFRGMARSLSECRGGGTGCEDIDVVLEEEQGVVTPDELTDCAGLTEEPRRKAAPIAPPG